MRSDAAETLYDPAMNRAALIAGVALSVANCKPGATVQYINAAPSAKVAAPAGAREDGAGHVTDEALAAGWSFYCRSKGPCFRSPDGCVDSRAREVMEFGSAPPCVSRTRAACIDTVVTLYGTTSEACFIDFKMCNGYVVFLAGDPDVQPHGECEARE